MAIWTRCVLAVCLAMLAAACGTMTSGRSPAAHAKASSPQPTAPAVTVTPDTGLAGGQPLRVRLTGFPPDVTIELYECMASARCNGAAAVAVTGSTGSASTTFIAQPSVPVGASTVPARCDSRCVLVAVAIKNSRGIFPEPAPEATARLAFAAAPPATADLAYSSLLGTSWISVTEGWALAAQPCAVGTCARVARTTDGGQHWQVLPDPPATIQDGTANCSAEACVTQLAFASATVGYLYGPALLMTTDGGLTWHALPGLQTETLTIADGQVYRVAYSSDGCPDPCQPSLQEAQAGSASWRTTVGQVAQPDRSDSAQIAVSGPDVLLAMYGSLAGPFPAKAVLYRSTDGGSTWQQSADPCGGPGPESAGQEKDLLGLAAAPGGFLAGLCVTRATMDTFVITSTDAGATWQPTAASPSGQGLSLIAVASPATIAVASGPVGGAGTYTTELQVTTDGGRDWVTAATDTQNLSAGSAPAWLGFETPLSGQWLGDPHGIWTTSDGGLHWTRAAFR